MCERVQRRLAHAWRTTHPPSGICDYAIGLMLRTLSAHTNPCDLSSQSQKVMVTDESNVVSMTTLELTSPS